MAAVDVQTPEPAPGLPDYVLNPNAVLKDGEAKWRYGRAPDYSKTRQVFKDTKKSSHEAGSLPDLVENLVKNWEVEASFKTDLADWRTIDHANYTFSVNGGPSVSGEHMLKVGTYNAIIASNEYYCPKNSDFASSHKTFKRMMPTFAWEVLEVYSGPPKVSFRWRHWGVMKNDYVGFNDKGEKISVKAHGGLIDIEGVTVAKVDDQLRLQSVETWFDPLEMFRQIAPNGIVNKEPVDRKVYPNPEDALGDEPAPPPVPQKDSIVPQQEPATTAAHHDQVDDFLARPAEEVHPHPRQTESAVHPQPGEGVAVTAGTEEVAMTHEEMSNVTAAECPFLMNRE